MVESSRHTEFVDLLQRHHQQLFAYIFALLRNLHDTEDLFQQASVIWYAKFADFESGTNFVAWASRIARLEVQNFYRRQGRSRVVFSSDVQEEIATVAGQSEDTFSMSRLDALARCLERLSAPDRHLLDLVYAQGLSVQQVALRRGRPLKGLYSSMGRIRNVLQECIRRTMLSEGG